MGRIARGVTVRCLYSLCIFLMTTLVVVMYNGGFVGSGLWVFALGILALIIEFFITKKMTQGFDWKWFSPCTIIFAVNGLACVWFLQIRSLSYSSQGLDTCTNYTAVQELRNMDLKVASHWLDFCSCGHCNGAAEQLFVVMLMLGRYFLPKGVSFYHPHDDNINVFLKSIARTHFFLAITCNGADALDLISYSRFPTVQGISSINSILLILFSMGVAQFCIDTLATKESKSSDLYIIIETDLWSTILIMFTNDLPYFAMRLFLMGKYQVFSAMGMFYMFKNFVSVFVALHKIAVIWWGKDYDEIEEYVVSEPYTPEPTRKEIESRIDTPDSLNELSDTESMFSHAQALKSRQERKHPEPLRKEKTEEWGDKEEWFGESKADFKSEAPAAPGDSQFLGSSEWDVEKGTADKNKHPLYGHRLEIWNPGADPQYFTENYADEQDAMLDMSKIGGRKSVPIPLGDAVMRGKIDFSKAAPKPELRDIETAQSTRRQKKTKEEPGAEDEWSDETKKRQDDKVNDDIDDIINTVDGEDDDNKKEKKKKKKKDKERDREKSMDVDGDAPGSDNEEKKQKKKKKKKSRDDEGEEEAAEVDREAEEERKEKHKKKKKSKDKDKD